MNYLCKQKFFTSQRQVFSTRRISFEVHSGANGKQEGFPRKVYEEDRPANLEAHQVVFPAVSVGYHAWLLSPAPGRVAGHCVPIRRLLFPVSVVRCHALLPQSLLPPPIATE